MWLDKVNVILSLQVQSRVCFGHVSRVDNVNLATCVGLSYKARLFEIDLYSKIV
jgi:hypothetical protein